MGVPPLRDRSLDTRPPPPHASALVRGRDAVAVVGSRTAARLARMAGYSATSLPGLVADRVSPGIGHRLASDLGPVTLVSGTNGKTTTARTLATILRRTGRTVVANASGANLGQAVTSALVARAELTGAGLRRAGGYGVFEVDEAALPALVEGMRPDLLLLTNLFRDQLDRFGETDRIVRLWRPVLAAPPSGLRVVFCADDPRLSALAGSVPDALAYGFAVPPAVAGRGDVTVDVSTCPVCAGELAAAWTSIGHLGDYRCRSCGFARPEPWLAVRIVESSGFAGQTLGFCWRGEVGASSERPSGETELTVRVRLIGPANAYNAAAAVAAAVSVGVGRAEAVAALDGIGGPFGRWETFEIDGRLVVLSLVKNPASLDEVARAGSGPGVDGIVFAFNDAHADGRDVSWYWDVDPTALVPGRRVAITGTRAPDFLLRLRYELLDDPSAELEGLVGLFERPVDGLDAMLGAVPTGGTVLVVSTYTALLGLRAELVARGHLGAMPT